MKMVQIRGGRVLDARGIPKTVEMGSFLDKPVVKKETHNVEGNGLRAGAAAMQGWRVTMEDAHTLVVGMDGLPDHSFFAVYDGHGGDMVAKHAGKHMLGKILATEEWKEYVDVSDKTTQHAAAMIGDALRQAFFDCDTDMRRKPEVERGEDHSGCTAVAAIVSPSHIVVANAGDSRCVLAKGGNMIPMSFDHKPYHAEETERIEKAGGCVSMRRVNGDLAVSRALGDFNYKQTPGIGPAEQPISSEADIKIEIRDGYEEFLVIACDGIWDVMDNDEVTDYVRENLLHYEDPSFPISNAACDIVDTCLVKGSRDNMSAMVIAFVKNPIVKIAAEPQTRAVILNAEEYGGDGLEASGSGDESREEQPFYGPKATTKTFAVEGT